MVKIKTFQFLISNYVGNECFNTTNYRRNCNTGKSEKEDYHFPKYDSGCVSDSWKIDKAINDFINDKKIISIQTDTYTVHEHNNSYCDSIIARYTIIYEEA